MNELMMRMMMQMFSNASGGQQQNTQQQDTQESLANNLLTSATPALGTVATKLASGEKFNVGDIGSVLQGASPALNMIPGVGTIASAGTNILGSVLQGLGNKQEEFKPGQVMPQVTNPYMYGGRLKSYQFGGPMKQYNAPPHSMGGQAVDANGNPTMNPQQGAAEIEKQEMYSSAGPGDGFVFSDEIRLPNGMTLAQKAAEIEKKFGKFKDAISMATKERELKKLAEYGEAMKKQMQEQAAQQQMQDSQRMQMGAPTNEEIQQRQMMMQQQQGMPQGQMPMMQLGGNMQDPPSKKGPLVSNLPENQQTPASQFLSGSNPNFVNPNKTQSYNPLLTYNFLKNSDIGSKIFGTNPPTLNSKDGTFENKDSAIEDLVEYVDATGMLSWDDALASGLNYTQRASEKPIPLASESNSNSNRMPSLSEVGDMLSAVPVFGKVKAGMKGEKIPSLLRTITKGNQRLSNTINATSDLSSAADEAIPNLDNIMPRDNTRVLSQLQYGGKLKAEGGLKNLPNKYDPLYSTLDPFYQQDFYKNRGVDYTIPFDPYSGITSPSVLTSLISSKHEKSALGQSGGANTAANLTRLAGTGTQDPLLNPNTVGYQPSVTLGSQFGGAPLGPRTLPSLPPNKSDKSKTQEEEEEEKLKLGPLNKAALALKAAGILGAGLDAFQKPEVVNPRLPNFAAQDQYFSETGIDPQLMLNQANLQKNAAMQAASQGAGSYGQFLNRANAIMRGTQDAQSQALLSAQQYNDQMSMARGARGDRNAGITSQIQQQADVLNAQNRAAQANAKANLYSLATQAGSTLSQMQYAQDAMKNQNELARLSNLELAAAYSLINPDFKLPIDQIINMTEEQRKDLYKAILERKSVDSANSANSTN